MRMTMSSTPFYSESSRRKEEESLSKNATARATASNFLPCSVSQRASHKVVALSHRITSHRIIPYHFMLLRHFCRSDGRCVARIAFSAPNGPKGLVLLFWFPWVSLLIGRFDLIVFVSIVFDSRMIPRICAISPVGGIRDSVDVAVADATRVAAQQPQQEFSEERNKSRRCIRVNHNTISIIVM